MFNDFVRYILNGILLIGIYSETGIYTAVFAFLTSLALELHFRFGHKN